VNDSALYTGLDGEPAKGVFGNETVDEAVAEKIREQETQIKELTPQLEGIIAMLDAEIQSVMSIDRFTTAAAQKKEDLRAELQASALYKHYLDTLKTKFALALNETKKNG